jgi:competence protein ComEC
VLDNFSVGELWVSRDIDIPVFRALLAEARARGTQIVFHHRGDSFEWDAVAGRILWPEELGTVTRPTNNDSLVIRLEHFRVAMLLPGDIEQQVERQLVALGEPLSADFLKIAHHGSKTSTTPEFLAAVAPRVEAISAGEGNPYGHPNASVLEELAGRGARLLRTDRDGAITVTSDGQTIRVRSFAGGNSP